MQQSQPPPRDWITEAWTDADEARATALAALADLEEMIAGTLQDWADRRVELADNLAVDRATMMDGLADIHAANQTFVDSWREGAADERLDRIVGVALSAVTGADRLRAQKQTMLTNLDRVRQELATSILTRTAQATQDRVAAAAAAANARVQAAAAYNQSVAQAQQMAQQRQALGNQLLAELQQAPDKIRRDREARLAIWLRQFEQVINKYPPPRDFAAQLTATTGINVPHQPSGSLGAALGGAVGGALGGAAAGAIVGSIVPGVGTVAGAVIGAIGGAIIGGIVGFFRGDSEETFWANFVNGFVPGLVVGLVVGAVIPAAYGLLIASPLSLAAGLGITTANFSFYTFGAFAIGGALFATTYQVFEMLDGTRPWGEFSLAGIALGTFLGGAAPILFIAAPTLTTVLFSANGLISGINNLRGENYWTGGFEVVTALIPLGVWGMRRFVFRGERGLALAEEITGNRAALPTRAQLAEYRAAYRELINALRQAGQRGITLEEAVRLCPELAAGEDSFWTIIGRLSGAMSRRWLFIREVGAWVVRGTGPIETRIIINIGRPRWFPWWNTRNRPATLREPRPFNEVEAHLGHSHPYNGILELSGNPTRGDIGYLLRLFRQDPYSQPLNPVLTGPTGQWRHVNPNDLLVWLQFDQFWRNVRATDLVPWTLP